MLYLYAYLFWAVVGIIAGLFCAFLDEGERMDTDRRLTIQFLGIIISYVIGTTLFGGTEPEYGHWIPALVVQVACTEVVYRLLRRFSPLR